MAGESDDTCVTILREDQSADGRTSYFLQLQGVLERERRVTCCPSLSSQSADGIMRTTHNGDELADEQRRSTPDID